MNAIYELHSQVAKFGALSEDYIAKMMHEIPDTKSVDRTVYLVKAATGKVVLDLGASGPMALNLQRVSKEYYGLDSKINPEIVNFHKVDFDKAKSLPSVPGLELVVAGEILEHVSNAGHFLDLVHALGRPVILTTPNAYSRAGQHYNARGIECVNGEHVAWYSYKTLKVLTERHKFRLIEWFWYNGDPYVAEGLIFRLEPING